MFLILLTNKLQKAVEWNGRPNRRHTKNTGDNIQDQNDKNYFLVI